MDRYGRLILETWIGMESFLNSCIRGYHKHVIKLMSSDEIIRQYQAKVALYLAAHYGHYDLANSMMNLGARPDRPVGEHPSRQWCAELSSMKPEYLKCPIHEAVRSGQLKIVTLFSKDLWVLQEKDGFGVLPWRLALRNDHKDPVKNANQKDVARFLLANQFSARVKLFSNFTISNFLYYKLKSWADRAKQRVLVSHGLSRTSYKKKPFQLGALIGYKVLIDGYNNNFKDYPSMVDEIQSKNSLIYFKDEEEKKNTVDPEVYFRTQNTFGMLKFGKLKSVSKFSKLADGNKEQKKSKQPESKARIRWRRAYAMIVNQNFFIKMAQVHGEQLEDLGYDMKEKINESLNFNKNNQTAKKDKEKEKKKTKKERKSSLLPPIKKVKSISINEFYTSANSVNKLETIEENKKAKKASVSSMSMISLTKFPKIKPDSQLESALEDSLGDKMKKMIALVNEPSRSNLPSLGNFNANSLTSSSIFKSSSLMSLDDLKEETAQSFVKYCDGYTPRDIAKKCLKEASLFNGKSWLKQFKIGVSMAEEQTKRCIFKKY